jgi:D-alanyl-D-alanine carboxypeptidase
MPPGSRPKPASARLSRRRWAQRVCLLPLLLALAACASGTPTPPPAATVHPTTQPTDRPTPAGRDAELQQLVDTWSEQNDPVGVSAAVLYPDGDLWLGTAGFADRAARVPISPTDRFEIASLTKTFMSALTLRLAEQGVVELDQPIIGLLPSFPAADVITIRMLLGHRAGVFDPTSQLVTDRFGPPDPERVFTPQELLDAAAAGTPVFTPGTAHDYSNANYWVLAACLEAATGERVATLLDEQVIRPAGLTDTLLFDDSLPDVTVVNAYKDLDLDGIEDPMGTRPLPGLVTPAWTAGGMISTSTDLVHFLDALFSGNLLTDDSLTAMLDTNSGGGTYALGIYRANGRWGHDGGIAGYLSAAFHDPSTGVTVAVLTNRFGPDAPQADALAPTLAALANHFASGG